MKTTNVYYLHTCVINGQILKLVLFQEQALDGQTQKLLRKTRYQMKYFKRLKLSSKSLEDNWAGVCVVCRQTDMPYLCKC